MNASQQRELRDLLLACSSVERRQTRDAIVSALSDRIQSNVERSQTDRDDVANLLRTCLNYANGLEELIAALRDYERDSIQMQEVDRLLLRLFEFSVDREEPHLRLLSLAAQVDLAVDRLQEIYRSLLPEGVEEREAPLGMLAMLSHLWNLSRQPETQVRQRTYPILDFVEQLARYSSTRRVAGELRAWAAEVNPTLYQGEQRMAGGGASVEGEEPLYDSRRLMILASVLAYMYPTIEASGEVVAQAQLNPVRIAFREMPLANWQSILAEATRRERIPALVQAALAAHPGDPWLTLAQREVRPTRSVREMVRDRPMALGMSADGGPEPTPAAPPAETQHWPQDVVFLEQGWQKASPVAKVSMDGGGSSTGFLIPGNLLIVPSFVIRTAAEAQKVVVQFNFQRAMDELYASAEECRLAPEEGFATSADGQWTAVRVEGDPNSRWGALELKEIHPEVGDPLSVVHHAFGGPKQIELLSSTVSYVDERRIQYSYFLKQPGAAGAPVFDLTWHVVAMHVAAGPLRDPITGESAWRREGTHVNAILKGLKEAGLYAV